MTDKAEGAQGRSAKPIAVLQVVVVQPQNGCRIVMRQGPQLGHQGESCLPEASGMITLV